MADFAFIHEHVASMVPSSTENKEGNKRRHVGDMQFTELSTPHDEKAKAKAATRLCGSSITYTDYTQSLDLKMAANHLDSKWKNRRHTLQHDGTNKEKKRSNGRDGDRKKDLGRSHTLSQAPIGELINRVVSQEGETKESRRLLKDAISRLEASERHAKNVEQEKKELELSQARHGLRVLDNVIGVQEELAKARQDAGVYKAQLEFAEHAIEHAKQAAKTVQDERDDAERAASQARATARKLNEEKLVMIARDEGRKQGFAEGMERAKAEVLSGIGVVQPQGITHRSHEIPLGRGGAYIEEFEEEERSSERTVSGHSSRRHRGGQSVQPTPSSQQSRPVPPTPQIDHGLLRQETEIAEAARREAHRLEIQLQAERVEAEMERERLRARQIESEREHDAWRKREREQEVMAKRETEALRDELRKERIIRDEKERELLRRLEDQEREVRRKYEFEERRRQQREEKKLQRERELETRQRRDLERETASVSSGKPSTDSNSSLRLRYMPMPPPPTRTLLQRPVQLDPTSSQPVIPEFETHSVSAKHPHTYPTSRSNGATLRSALRHTSHHPQPFASTQPSGSNTVRSRRGRQSSTDTAETAHSRGYRRRTSSSDSQDTAQSPSSGMSSLDIVTFSVAGRKAPDQLSDIPEGSSIKSGSQGGATSPSWLRNPPVDYSKRQDVDHWRRNSGTFDPPDPSGPPVIAKSAREYIRSSANAQSGDLRNSSTGDSTSSVQSNEYRIRVEPPSNSPSDLGQESEQNRPGFLSPNSAHIQLPPPQTFPEPAEPPVIPNGTQLPSSFVPFSSSFGHSTQASEKQTNNSQAPQKGNRIYSNYTTPVSAPTASASGFPLITSSRLSSKNPAIPPQPAIYGGFSKSNSSSSSSSGHKSRYLPRTSTAKPQRQVYSSTPSSNGSNHDKIYANPNASSSGQHPGSIYQQTQPAGSSINLSKQTPRQSSRQIYAPTVTAAPNNSSSRQTPGQSSRQIYAPTPPTALSVSPVLPLTSLTTSTPGLASMVPPRTSASPNSMQRRSTFHQIYALTSPAGHRHPPVLPSIPSSSGPTLFIPPVQRAGSAGATPRVHHHSLPGGYGGGNDGEDDDDDRGDISPETKKNTMANSRMKGSGEAVLGALPIPPPSNTWRP